MEDNEKAWVEKLETARNALVSDIHIRVARTRAYSAIDAYFEELSSNQPIDNEFDPQGNPGNAKMIIERVLQIIEDFTLDDAFRYIAAQHAQVPEHQPLNKAQRNELRIIGLDALTVYFIEVIENLAKSPSQHSRK